MLADMAIGIETARLATRRAAWEVDQVCSLSVHYYTRFILLGVFDGQRSEYSTKVYLFIYLFI